MSNSAIWLFPRHQVEHSTTWEEKAKTLGTGPLRFTDLREGLIPRHAQSAIVAERVLLSKKIAVGDFVLARSEEPEAGFPFRTLIMGEPIAGLKATQRNHNASSKPSSGGSSIIRNPEGSLSPG